MGWPHCILEWVRCEADGQFYYREVYAGRSWFKALQAFLKAKRTAGCVRWEWRG